MKSTAANPRFSLIRLVPVVLLLVISFVMKGRAAGSASEFAGRGVQDPAQEPAQSKPATESAPAQSAPADTNNPDAAGRGRGARRGGARRPDRAPAGAPIAIEHARILRAGMPALEDATILIRGRRIAEVGRKVSIPDNARKVDGTGMTVTAGWIDARGMTPLEMPAANDGNSNAAFHAMDGLDLLDPTGRIRAAAERGVTACYISSGVGVLSGMGALVHMRPGEKDPEKIEVADSEGASFVMGSVRGEGVVARQTQWATLRRTLRDAQKYREALDQYETDFQKFLEDKKKGLKPVARPEADAPKPPDGDAPRPSPNPGPRGRRQPRTPEESELLNIAKALGIRPIVNGPDGEFILDDQAVPPEDEERICDCGSQRPGHQHPPGDDPPFYIFQDPPKPADSKTTERPKKPDFNPSFRALLPVLRREIPARFEARRADEIKAVIALAQEFHLKAIIEGADEAALVADEIAKSGFPVVLAPVSSAEPGRANRDTETAAILARKGVTLAFGTGRNPQGTKWLRMQTAAAMAGGMSADQALAAVTTNAAGLIGVGNEMGTLAPGKLADLVVFAGDPFDPATRVKVVVIDGEVVIEQ